MANKSIIPDLLAGAPNRRSFVKKIGLASAAAGAVFTVGGKKTFAQSSGHPNDIDILTFALMLEYLEAEFYTVATTGNYLPSSMTSGSGNVGVTTGGKAVNFSNNLVFTGNVAQETAADERAHVNFIRSAFQAAGATPPAKPEINLNALGIGFGNEVEFLTLARTFENIGVTAYAAAAPLLSNKTYLQAAAQILAAEAMHVGNIQLETARLGIKVPQLDSVDILPPPAGSNFYALDNNGMCALRTPGQVLYLAYGNQVNATAGGFFPTGINGYFTMSSTPA